MKNRSGLLGYTLVELSIVLVVIGLIGFLSIKFLSNIGNQALNQKFKNDLDGANLAILGFIYANNRLPCPDISGNGNEECGTGTTNKVGFLPIKTLGVESSLQKKRGGLIRYGVYRNQVATLSSDLDLASKKNRYEPVLPNSETSNQENGLDLCLALKTGSLAASNAAQINIGASSTNVAYVLSDSGAADANNDGVLFDGTNGSGLKFEKPSKSKTNIYDDNVIAVGFNELSGRLNCARVLAETNGAARASYAAYDMWLLATLYKEFRDFHVDYLDSMLRIARTQRDLALAAVAIGAVSAIIAAANLALDTTGASAVGLALSILAVADAAYSLVQALEGVTGAQEAYNKGVEQRTQATASLTQALQFKNTKLALVKSLDMRGLLR